MKYILVMSLKSSYELFGAQVHIVVIFISSINHLLQVKKKMVNANIVEL